MGKTIVESPVSGSTFSFNNTFTGSTTSSGGSTPDDLEIRLLAIERTNQEQNQEITLLKQSQSDLDNKLIEYKVERTSELINDSSYVSDPHYIHTDNNYTNEDKSKLIALHNYDDTELKQLIASNKEEAQSNLNQAKLDVISASNSYADQVGAGVLSQSKSYTNNRLAALLGTVPETLDTFEEIKAAFDEDQTILDTLNAAIGSHKLALDATNANVSANTALLENIKSSYLPLTAGSSKPLTDDLYITSGKYIRLGSHAFIRGDDTDGRLTISAGKDRILTIRPNPDNSTGQMHIYGTVFRPGTKDGVQLGTDSAPWSSIYGTAIYQDGKQVANKSDVNKQIEETTVNHISSSTGIADAIFNNAKCLFSYAGEVNNREVEHLPIDIEEEYSAYTVIYIPDSNRSGNASQQITCVLPESRAGEVYVRTAKDSVWGEWEQMVTNNILEAHFEVVNEKLDNIKEDTSAILSIHNYDPGSEDYTIIEYNGAAGTNTIQGLRTTGHKIIVNDVIITESSVANQTFELSYPKKCIIQISGDVQFYNSSSTTETQKFLSIDFGKQAVTSLGYTGGYNLAYYTNLERVDMSRSSISSVYGHSTFYNDTKLKSVIWPTSPVTFTYSSGTYTSYRMFYNCSSLETMILPEGLTDIGSSMFSGCSKLTHVTIPSSVTYINESAFYGCALLDNLVFSSPVTVVGNSAFYNCKALKSIQLDESELTSVGTYAFYYCQSLKHTPITKYITNYMYAYCTSLTSADLSNVLTTGMDVLNTKANYAFSNCTGLVSVNLGGLCPSQYMFQNCTSLTEVTDCGPILNTYVFSGCTALSDFSQFSNVTTLSSYCFTGCPFSGSLYSESLVEILGYSPFGTNNTGIESISFPNLTTCANTAYFCYGFTSLKTASFPKLTLLPYNMFYNCTSLTSVDLSSVTTFYANSSGSSAMNHFYNCTSLKQISLPSIQTLMTTSPGSSARIGWTALEKVHLGPNITSSGMNGYYIFYYCSNLSDFTIETLTPPTIRSDCFSSAALTIKVPSSAVASYQAATNWSTKTITAI